MAEVKEIAFTTNVGTGGAVAVYPRQFYVQALYDLSLFNNSQMLMNVGNKTKWGNITNDTVLHADGCEFSFGNTTLSSKEITACKLQIGVNPCKSTLETSFYANYVADGQEGDIITYIVEDTRKQAAHSLERISWQGDTGSGDTTLALCDGLEKKIQAAETATTIPVTQAIAGTTITSSNVAVEMAKVFAAIPSSLVSKFNEMIWYVSPNVAQAFRTAIMAQSNEKYLNSNPELVYCGIKIVIAQGMSANRMVLTRGKNIGVISDTVNGLGALSVHDMEKMGVSNTYRVLGSLHFGVDIVNESEFIIYGFA